MKGRDLAVCIAAAGAAVFSGATARAGWPFPCGDDACAPVACAPGCDACAPGGPNCGYQTPYTLFSLFGIECEDEDEDEEESKLKKVCRCICPGEPPRAPSAVALPARFSPESAPEEESADEESATESALDDRCELLEQDLTRLTLIVEELAKGQAQDSQSLTRLTLAVEEIARAQSQSEQDLTRINLILQQMAEARADGQ